MQTRELKEFIEHRGPRIRQTVLFRAERDLPTVRAVAVRPCIERDDHELQHNATALCLRAGLSHL